MTVEYILMKVKNNRVPLFNAVEEGNRKYKNRIFALFKSSITKESKDQIRKFYGKEFKVKNKDDYTTSSLQTTEEEEEEEQINYKTKDYILERLKELQIKSDTERIYSQVA